MAMYQFRQETEKKLEQNLRSSRNKQKTNTELKTRTLLKQKRHLLVYKKDDKFYIDHFAAYALNRTNVRAVMLDSPKLMEVDLVFLNNLQSNEDIEIEYQDLNAKKEVRFSTSNLADTLEDLKQGEYGIGIHGIDQGSSDEKRSKAEGITSEGLFISNNSKTILSTAVSLGMNEQAQQLNQEITQYRFGNGPKCNVVIAVPLTVQNEKGESIFLGFPEKNKTTSGQQYEEHCILDRICAKMKQIPPEFILGYYYENSDGSQIFERNASHYSNLSPESKEHLYKQLSDNMDFIAKDFNEMIANGDIEQLSQMKQRMQGRNLYTHMLNNAIMLAEKYKEQKTPEKEVRRKILLVEERKDNLDKPKRSQYPKRQILLDSYQDVKLSDLTSAKETLREGIDEQEKTQEGKEI